MNMFLIRFSASSVFTEGLKLSAFFSAVFVMKWVQWPVAFIIDRSNVLVSKLSFNSPLTEKPSNRHRKSLFSPPQKLPRSNETDIDFLRLAPNALCCVDGSQVSPNKRFKLLKFLKHSFFFYP